MTFLGKIAEAVDDEFAKIFEQTNMTKVPSECIDKITGRMKAEATAYIDLKAEMHKKLTKRLNETE